MSIYNHILSSKIFSGMTFQAASTIAASKDDSSRLSGFLSGSAPRNDNK
jgi:hypothetical protein